MAYSEVQDRWVEHWQTCKGCKEATTSCDDPTEILRTHLRCSAGGPLRAAYDAEIFQRAAVKLARLWDLAAKGGSGETNPPA